MVFARAIVEGEECCQCENVASANANYQLETGNIGIGNTSTMATFTKMSARAEDKCCQCENVANINANYQLETGTIGIGNTSTMATFINLPPNILAIDGHILPQPPADS
jgi:ribose 5-phosphate isomerase